MVALVLARNILSASSHRMMLLGMSRARTFRPHFEQTESPDASADSSVLAASRGFLQFVSHGQAGSRRHNPSYLALLSEFVGVRREPTRFFSMAASELCLGRAGSHNGIGRLALFVFMQCSYREPQRVPDPVELRQTAFCLRKSEVLGRFFGCCSWSNCLRAPALLSFSF